MRTLFYEKFRFRANDCNVFDVATSEDIEELVEVYQNVKITENRIKTFDEKGGMFNALGKKEIIDILDDESSSILVVRKKGRIIALLWVSESDPSFPKTMEKGKTIYLRDIIVDDNSTEKIALTLVQLAIRVAFSAGNIYSFAEIYKVISYNEGKERIVNMLNERSFSVAMSLGGEFVGTFERKSIDVGAIKVLIEPQIIFFENENVLKSTNEEV